MAQVMFDLEVLRTFVAGVSLGSFARAADRLGRSTSAVSAQLRKLEGQAGTPLFRKAGRGLELTDAGRTLLAYAHRLLDLNDEASTAVRGVDMEGRVRLGLQEDLGESLLPAVLGRFARAHPRVRIEACVARSAELRERVERGRLDLALAWDTGDSAGGALHVERVVQLPLQWIASANPLASGLPWHANRARPGSGAEQEPLPLVLLEAPCPLREIATQALGRAGIRWRHAFSSASVAALWAAVSAGLGVSVRTRLGLPASVCAVGPSDLGLPALPGMALSLYREEGRQPPPAARLATFLAEAIRAAR